MSTAISILLALLKALPILKNLFKKDGEKAAYEETRELAEEIEKEVQEVHEETIDTVSELSTADSVRDIAKILNDSELQGK